MIEQVLTDGSADQLLLSGLVGEIFMLADGVDLGETTRSFIMAKGFEPYIGQARKYLDQHRDRIAYASDVAVESNQERLNVDLAAVTDDMMISDIGDQTIANYCDVIATAKTILVNGPPGIYENPLFEKGTEALWNAVANSDGFSVVGGGDSVTSFTRYVDMSKLNYVSTAGGALIRYLSGVELPLIKAMSRRS
jgi:phosphoglycerate kinase